MTDAFTLDILRNYLLVGAALFALGMLGFLARRNLIVMFLSAEMMLQGTALTPGRRSAATTATGPGQVFTIVILTVAACEASIALALIVILYNRRSSLDVTLWQDIREDGRAARLAIRRGGRGRAGRGVAGPRVVPAPDPRRHRAGPPRRALARAARLSSEQPESRRGECADSRLSTGGRSSAVSGSSCRTPG